MVAPSGAEAPPGPWRPGDEAETGVQENLERTAWISDLVFQAPPNRVTFPLLVGGSLLLGVVLDPSPRGLLAGLLYLALPGVAAALLSAPLATALGGTLYEKRAAFLALVGTGLVGVGVLLAHPLHAVFGVPLFWPLVIAAVFVASVRHAVLFVVSDNRHLRTLPVSLLQTLVTLPLLNLGYGFDLHDWTRFGLLLVTFLVPLVFFLEIFDRPMKRNFHASASEAFRAYLDHLTTGSFDAEAVIDRWSEPVDARFGVVAFRRGDGSVKGVIVVPTLHPGPFGRLGGGDLPGKVAEVVDQAPVVLVPHGPATHDFNPASSAEVERFARAVRDAVDGVVYEAGGSLACTAGSEVRVTSQLFGTGALLTYTSWPRAIDDVELGVGLAAELSARLAGARDAVFVDCHNSLRPGAGQVWLATPRADAIQRNAEAATAAATRHTVDQLRVGVARDTTTFTPREGVGSQGLQAVVVEAGDQRHAYLLWDGNNMVPEVTGRIVEALEPLVASAQVLTTDNHSVNAVVGSYSPVGHDVDPERLAEAARRVVAEAVADLEPVTSGLARGTVENLRVFGHQKSAMLAASINTMASIAPELVAATLVLQALATAVLFLWL